LGGRYGFQITFRRHNKETLCLSKDLVWSIANEQSLSKLYFVTYDEAALVHSQWFANNKWQVPESEGETKVIGVKQLADFLRELAKRVETLPNA
jgi:hypothetical protein